jgi:hypothetical protein
VLKRDHPCFFHFFYLSHAGGGFLLPGGLSFLGESGDISFELPGDCAFFPLSGIRHYSTPAPSSIHDRHRT